MAEFKGQAGATGGLDALKASEVDDRFRQAAETIYQALIEAELSSVIGALPRRGYLALPHST